MTVTIIKIVITFIAKIAFHREKYLNKTTAEYEWNNKNYGCIKK